MEINKKKFGEILKKKRMAKRLKLQDLADMVGVSREAIRLYEAGKSLPRDNKMNIICDALGISDSVVLDCCYDKMHYSVISEDEFEAKAHETLTDMSSEFTSTSYDLTLLFEFEKRFRERLFH